MATAIPTNQARFTIDEIRVAVRARAFVRSATGASSITSVVTDSRLVTAGCLFVAIQGERFDGHDHIEAAISAGAAGLLVSRAVETLSLIHI